MTLGALFFKGVGDFPETGPVHRIDLPDGDAVTLHEDSPPRLPTDAPVVLAVHGLCGSHRSPYMLRQARLLNARGVRAFRMNQRGCGTGAGMARMPYHSGRHDDLAEALRFVADRHPDAPLAVVGFSLGGNLALNLASRMRDDLPGRLRTAVAVCPPADILSCALNLHRGLRRLYDRYFAGYLVRHVAHARTLRPDVPPLPAGARPRRIIDFDDCYTAPVSGFADARDYYAKCSPASVLDDVELPTLVLAAADDPMIPLAPIADAPRSAAVHLTVTRHGGHCGFFGRRGADPNGRWMDCRVAEWVAAHLGDG